MDFYDYLKQNNLSHVLNEIPYTTPQFVNLNKVTDSIVSAIQDNKKIFIYGDYDVDGLMCALIMGEMLKCIDHFSFSYSQYRKRTHAFDSVAAHRCLQGGYDMIIICDTGSSEEDKVYINNLVQNGVEVVILDHHETTYTYDDYKNVSIINTEIENSMGGDYALSAGALCFCVANHVLNQFGKNGDFLSTYATVSLYSDCMDMGNSLNQAIYGLSKKVPNKPELLTIFLNQYSEFNARYFQFWFAPRVNAMFRQENLELINKMFFVNNSKVELKALADKMSRLYESNRAMIAQLSDIVEVEELKNFVICNLGSVNNFCNVFDNKLYNFTGLIANKLSAKYKKTAVVYCRTETNYKGSLRDFFSREYLYAFKAFCDAGGHNSAFGFFCSLNEISNIITHVRMLDASGLVGTATNSPVVIEVQGVAADDVLLKDVATYNEFAGQSFPYVYLKKDVIGSMQSVSTSYGYKSKWDKYTISSSFPLVLGSSVNLKPYLGKGVKMEVCN